MSGSLTTIRSVEATWVDIGVGTGEAVSCETEVLDLSQSCIMISDIDFSLYPHASYSFQALRNSCRSMSCCLSHSSSNLRRAVRFVSCPMCRASFVNMASFSSASSKHTSSSLIMILRLLIHNVGVTRAFFTGFTEWNVSFQSIC